MSIVTGFALATLIMVVGAIGLAAFAVHLKNRDETAHKANKSLNHA